MYRLISGPNQKHDSQRSPQFFHSPSHRPELAFRALVFFDFAAQRLLVLFSCAAGKPGISSDRVLAWLRPTRN